MKKFLILFILFVLSHSGFAFAAGKPYTSAGKLYEQKVNSVLFLETQEAYGSGIVVKEDGTFVTCFHVVANADYINAKTKDGCTYKVTGYKYLDAANDIAVLTLGTTKKFTPITFAPQNSIRVGDDIYAIANPTGLKFVFSDGMINQFSKKDIQFSAPASPGSSGGALLNKSGELIGMITSQYNPSKAQNINFALPTSFFLSHIDDKNKKNTKRLPWTEFVASKASSSALESYIQYAVENKNMSMMYKYMKYCALKDNIPSDKYVSLGTLALMGYMDGPAECKDILKDAEKWYALAINSNKNVEAASYGLVVTSLVKKDFSNIDCYCRYLKKYPKSYKQFEKYMAFMIAAGEKGDMKAFEHGLVSMFKYLLYLSKGFCLKISG